MPITVHCNDSNEAMKEYRLYSDPGLWARVLDDHEGLHLNLGHFGGARKLDDPLDPAAAWPAQIATLTGDYPHLFADTGDHRIDDEELAEAYFARLRALFQPGSATEAMANRLMYGSDWYMLALLPKSKAFLKEYRRRYTNAFGGEAERRFMGGAALQFLGLSDETRNRARLVARYQTLQVEMPRWLALAPP